MGPRVSPPSEPRLSRCRFDVGDIVAQAAVPVSPSVHVQQLTAELAQLGSELLERCMEDLPAALSAARPQTEDGVTLGEQPVQPVARN